MIVGVAVAALTGGAIPRPRLRSLLIVLAGLTPLLMSESKLVAALTALLLVAFAGTRKGMLRVALAGFALGMLANAAVALANGGMPVDQSIGLPSILATGRHVPLTEATRLPWLADVIPLPYYGGLASLGDYLMWLAVPAWIVAVSRANLAPNVHPLAQG